MINQGHVKIKVHNYNPDFDKTYQFVIDPLSYTEVDITDFAPRAIGTNVALGELGLYTDAGQEDFKHGFGQHEYSEPQSYAYSGHLVDARQGFLQLFNNPTAVSSMPTSNTIKKILMHRNRAVVLYSDRIGYIKTSNDTSYETPAAFGSETARDMISTGRYIFITTSGRMQVADVGQVSSATSSTLTMDDAGWSVDVFDGGTVYIIDGTGVGQSKSISGNNATTLTLTTTWSPNPSTDSIFVVVDDAGNDSNPPNYFEHLEAYGGYYWATEDSEDGAGNFLHFWAEEDGTDAEGDGLTDAAAIQVGAIGTPLVEMCAFDNQLFVFREDGAWTVHEDNLAYQTGVMFEDQLSSLNFASSLVWQGFLIFPVRNRIYKFKTGIQDITPPRWNDELPYKTFGNFSHMVVRGKYMYVLGQSNAVNSDETLEDNAGFAAVLVHDGVGWHKLIDFPDNTAAPSDYGMWLDQVNDRLYVYACVSGDPKLYYVRFETLSDFPYADYPTSTYCNLYTSYYSFSLPRIPKSFASLTLGGDFPSYHTTLVRVQYRIDDTTTWTTLGNFTSDMQEIDFPNSTTGKKIQLRLQLYTTSASATPVVKKLIIKLMLRPDVLYGVTLDIIVANNVSDPNRLICGLNAKQIRAALKEARDSIQPITFYDLYGESAYAYLASIRFISVAYEDMDNVQTIARCTIVYV
jgi:hypothetical protein